MSFKFMHILRGYYTWQCRMCVITKQLQHIFTNILSSAVNSIMRPDIKLHELQTSLSLKYIGHKTSQFA